MDDAATATYDTLHQVWVRSPIAPPAAEVAPALDGLYPSCLELKTANASAPSGVYYLNISSQAVRAYCDMEDRGDGGGWMLVLNYVRGGGLNPSLQLRTISSGFPLLRSTRLGSDESWMRSSSGTWGHLNVATLSKIDFDEVRFFGRISLHTRMQHFKTWASSLVSYFKTGVGSVIPAQLKSQSQTLSGHSALLLNNVNQGTADQGDYAPTARPFTYNTGYEWAIGYSGSWWSVDEYYPAYGNSYATLHQMWVRPSLLNVIASNPSAQVLSGSRLAAMSHPALAPVYSGNSDNSFRTVRCPLRSRSLASITASAAPPCTWATTAT